MIDPTHAWNKSTKPLTIGFLLSIVLTVALFYLNVPKLAIIGTALIQVLLQLVLFMHLGIEEKPRWNLMIFLFMVMVIIILVGGSLWIMHNLDYNMM